MSSAAAQSATTPIPLSSAYPIHALWRFGAFIIHNLVDRSGTLHVWSALFHSAVFLRGVGPTETWYIMKRVADLLQPKGLLTKQLGRTAVEKALNRLCDANLVGYREVFMEGEDRPCSRFYYPQFFCAPDILNVFKTQLDGWKAQRDHPSLYCAMCQVPIDCAIVDKNIACQFCCTVHVTSNVLMMDFTGKFVPREIWAQVLPGKIRNGELLYRTLCDLAKIPQTYAALMPFAIMPALAAKSDAPQFHARPLSPLSADEVGRASLSLSLSLPAARLTPSPSVCAQIAQVRALLTDLKPPKAQVYSGNVVIVVGGRRSTLNETWVHVGSRRVKLLEVLNDTQPHLLAMTGDQTQTFHELRRQICEPDAEEPLRQPNKRAADSDDAAGPSKWPSA